MEYSYQVIYLALYCSYKTVTLIDKISCYNRGTKIGISKTHDKLISIHTKKEPSICLAPFSTLYSYHPRLRDLYLPQNASHSPQ